MSHDDPRRLIAELDDRAAHILDPAVYDFVAGGSGGELSLGEAVAAWSAYRLYPRVLRDVSTLDTTVEVLGTRLASPVGVAPMGYQGLLHPEAEVATARGAAGHLTVVSTRSTRALEDVAAAAGPWWFQVYVTAQRSLTEALVERAVTAGAQALVLTGDTPYVGRKARGGRPETLGSGSTVANFAVHLPPGADPAAAIEQNPAASMADIGWLAQISGLPVLVKGVLRGDDAARCLDSGAAGLIVSNHGGRQLDRAVASASTLPEVVAAAGDAPVLVDGGVRCGLDVLVALALGARAVLVGRPVAWALACDGADGVAGLLRVLDDDLAHVLGLAGCTSCADVPRDLVRPLGSIR